MITTESLQKRPLSFSSLKEFLRSPSHYVKYVSEKREPTPAMMLGTLVHKLILEPDDFNNQFAIMPKLDLRKTVDKEKAAEFEKSNVGKTIVSDADYSKAKEIMANFRASPCYKYTTGSGKSEQRFEFIHADTGLPVTGYIDKEEADFNLEIKTVQSAELDELQRDFYNRKYYLQSGIYNYSNGKPILYIAIETNPPYLSRAVWADEDYVQSGKNLFNKAMADFKYCMDMELFDNGYEFYGGLEPVSLSLPSWAKKGG